MDDHLTAREARYLLGVTDCTLKRLVRDGRLECFRTPGGHRRFVLDDVERLRSGADARPTRRPTELAAAWTASVLALLDQAEADLGDAPQARPFRHARTALSGQST